ncbi:MAG: histidine phosphatase family protein, partial [Deltaproteobacteria bacterium]
MVRFFRAAVAAFLMLRRAAVRCFWLGMQECRASAGPPGVDPGSPWYAGARGMRRILLARHGQTSWNALGRLQGHTDIELNDVGREQARELAARLASAELTAVWASDLARARQTGEIVAAALGLAPPTVDPDLRERHYGVFEGRDSTGCGGPHGARARPDRGQQRRPCAGGVARRRDATVADERARPERADRGQRHDVRDRSRRGRRSRRAAGERHGDALISIGIPFHSVAADPTRVEKRGVEPTSPPQIAAVERDGSWHVVCLTDRRSEPCRNKCGALE